MAIVGTVYMAGQPYRILSEDCMHMCVREEPCMIDYGILIVYNVLRIGVVRRGRVALACRRTDQ